MAASAATEASFPWAAYTSSRSRSASVASSANALSAAAVKSPSFPASFAAAISIGIVCSVSPGVNPASGANGPVGSVLPRVVTAYRTDFRAAAGSVHSFSSAYLFSTGSFLIASATIGRYWPSGSWRLGRWGGAALTAEAASTGSPRFRSPSSTAPAFR